MKTITEKLTLNKQSKIYNAGNVLDKITKALLLFKNTSMHNTIKKWIDTNKVKDVNIYIKEDTWDDFLFKFLKESDKDLFIINNDTFNKTFYNTPNANTEKKLINDLIYDDNMYTLYSYTHKNTDWLQYVINCDYGIFQFLIENSK